jgi:hypothetical protein
MFAVSVLNGGPPDLTAHAESKPKDATSKLKDAQSKLQALIDRLRHGAMPEGIAKSNGRIEARRSAKATTPNASCGRNTWTRMKTPSH